MNSEMMIEPKIRGFICTTAHPLGCQKAVQNQIEFIQNQKPIIGPKRVLVIGASTGYGLASIITALFGANAKTIGVFYEKAADEKRTASPGWYNIAALEKFAKSENHEIYSVNGDAFSQEIKEKTAKLIREKFSQVDLIIYSLASPRRTDPKTGETYHSALKPIGQSFKGKTVDAFKAEVKTVEIDPATPDEIKNTIAVMGGDDWQQWINYLLAENLLSEGVTTVAYSYIGPAITHAIYKEGTIGRAKDDLKRTAEELNERLMSLKGRALISVNKAVVTQASAAIPVVPLYISILFKIMKENGTHEGCIEQIYRLFKDYLYPPNHKAVIKDLLVRVDDLEMRKEVQEEIIKIWSKVNSENIFDLTDLRGYQQDFYQLFGFHLKNVDYHLLVDPSVSIASLA